jgi:predicted secreted protein
MAEIVGPRTYSLRQNQDATIRATGQGVGGYTWNADIVQGSAKIEALTEKLVDPIPGKSATVAFKVSEVDPDGCTVRLCYRRTWEAVPLIDEEIRIDTK